MKSELEIVAADGARKLVVVAHKPYVIDELDVRVVPLDHSVRVEPLLEGDLLHLDGDEWLQKQLRRLDRQVQRGDLSNAENDLDKMEKYVVIPEWQTMIAERRARWQSQQ